MPMSWKISQQVSEISFDDATLPQPWLTLAYLSREHLMGRGVSPLDPADFLQVHLYRNEPLAL